MLPTTARRLAPLLVLAALAAAGCRDPGPDPAIRDAVSRWLEAWVIASGPARNDVAAADARAVLGGDLLSRTDTVARGPAGALRPRMLATLLSEYVGLAFPPDRGFEVLTVDRDGESARVAVRLRYSAAAAGAAAAAGLIPFRDVAHLTDLVERPPERVFTVTRVKGEWRITAIRPG